MTLTAVLALAQNRSVNRGGGDAVRLPELVKVMEVGEGSIVADIGAGGGHICGDLAKMVGSTGKVYAVDISERAIRDVKSRAERDNMPWLVGILSEVADPKLPAPAELDAAMFINSYHEMNEHRAILKAVYAALKPGGRLVISESHPGSGQNTRDEQTKRHDLAANYVEAEIKEAGFELVKIEPDWHKPTSGRGQGRWLLKAVKPLAN